MNRQAILNGFFGLVMGNMLVHILKHDWKVALVVAICFFGVMINSLLRD